MPVDYISHRVQIGSYTPKEKKKHRQKYTRNMNKCAAGFTSIPVYLYWCLISWLLIIDHFQRLLFATHATWKAVQRFFRIIATACNVVIYLACLILAVSGDVHPNPGPNNMQTNTSLGCIVLNAQSLKTVNTNVNKLPEFQKIVYTDKPEIIAVSETWLNMDTLDNSILSDKLYEINRKDPPSRGGGVLLAVSKHLYSKKRPELTPIIADSNEILPVEVRLTKSRKVLVISAYRPQADCPFKFNDNLEQTLQNAVKSNFTEFILLGDFNHPDLKWGTCRENNVPKFSTDFVSLIERYGLIQYNKNASTKAGNILELILTNIPTGINSICAGYYPFRSDHYLLKCDINS